MVAKKNAHIISTDYDAPVRVDLYLAGKDFNLKSFVNSFYFFSLFSNQDYLKAGDNMPFGGGLIIPSIEILPMGEYKLLVRRSISGHTGRSKLNFYNNQSYYEKMMNRPVASRNEDGSLEWSTMAKEDARLLESFKKS